MSVAVVVLDLTIDEAMLTRICPPTLMLPHMQVWLLKWDGQAVQIAAYGAGPRAALLGALPDRLILVRSAPGGRAQMATRAVSLLPPLLQAWASLPASGLLPGAHLNPS
jgi:hypothetical protein